ncbi:MAG: hypothetical protein L6R40_000241 [Gallowayella cf. fulva]|nr:MAG: hypothetical protein L6R40_000241 [Xanthomendoza cf. fulva]
MAMVESSMHFLMRDELYEHEKPYQLKYAAAEGIPTSNFRLEKQEPIQINSIRGREQDFSFDKNGFAVLKIDEDMPYDDFSDPEGIRRYLNIVASSLQKLLGADKVQVFQYVRISSAMRSGEADQFQDATHEEAISTFQKVNGDRATLSPNLRYQVVNVWKPLRGPLRDWPLALCDAESVHADHLAAADGVFETKITENLQVHYDAAHRWYYLEDQEASELLVFRQADSHPAGRLGVPHTSFPNPKAGPNELPRESIEVRTLVSYGDVD